VRGRKRKSKTACERKRVREVERERKRNLLSNFDNGVLPIITTFA